MVQNPALASILSEARKFNLFVVLTQQYLSQVDKDLRDAIFANVSNYYCFKVAEEDALHLVGNLPMELPTEMLVEAKEKGVKEETLKIRMLTELSPRECIVRMASGGLLLPCFKARTLDVGNNTIQTTMNNGFIPEAYLGKAVTIAKFTENLEPATFAPLKAPPQTTSPIVQIDTDVPALQNYAELPKLQNSSNNLPPLQYLSPLETQSTNNFQKNLNPEPITETAISLQSEPPPGINTAGPPLPPHQNSAQSLGNILNQQSTQDEKNGSEENK